jgi:hypothetical protein
MDHVGYADAYDNVGDDVLYIKVDTEKTKYLLYYLDLGQHKSCSVRPAIC